jgi:N-acetylneuraminate synthase/sialic acid synthase
MEGTNEIAVLHCVSEYPTEVDRLGMQNIKKLIQEFPECTIGLSDHFSGTLSGPIAYTEGARVFEKHVTLNHAWKGTDHSFALEVDGMRRFTRDIRRVPLMFNSKPEEEIGSEHVFQKLGKSIIASKDILKGETLSLDSLSGRIFDIQHIPVRESNTLIGKTVTRNIMSGEPITKDILN